MLQARPTGQAKLRNLMPHCNRVIKQKLQHILEQAKKEAPLYGKQWQTKYNAVFAAAGAGQQATVPAARARTAGSTLVTKPAARPLTGQLKGAGQKPAPKIIIKRPAGAAMPAATPLTPRPMIQRPMIRPRTAGGTPAGALAGAGQKPAIKKIIIKRPAGQKPAALTPEQAVQQSSNQLVDQLLADGVWTAAMGEAYYKAMNAGLGYDAATQAAKQAAEQARLAARAPVTQPQLPAQESPAAPALYDVSGNLTPEGHRAVDEGVAMRRGEQFAKDFGWTQQDKDTYTRLIKVRTVNGEQMYPSEKAAAEVNHFKPTVIKRCERVCIRKQR